MGYNKSAHIRYRAIDKCLINRQKRHFIKDLLEACNQALFDFYGEDGPQIKKRQLYQDLVDMETNYDTTIERIWEGRRKYFRYANPHFSIKKLPMSEDETRQLKEAIAVLSRLKGLPQFTFLGEVIPRMNKEFGFQLPSEKVYQFEENPDVRGLKLVEPLFHHIIKKRVLAIVFKQFNNNVHRFIIHPYILKQYNKRWFLVGWNEKESKIWIVSLDRIEDIQENNDIVFRENTTDLEGYFKDVIGITVYPDKPIQTVLLRIYNPSIPYIRTKPLHQSQQIKRTTKEYMDIEIRVRKNYELEAIILNLGDHVEVLSPPKLRAEIAERIQKANRFYQND